MNMEFDANKLYPITPLPVSREAYNATCKELDEAKAQTNAVYAERDKLVSLVYKMAKRLGLNYGIAEHVLKEGEVWDPDWHSVVFIDLPTGQVSWHIHSREQDWFSEGDQLRSYNKPYDGHTTEEKYKRVLAYE